ncbi:MAG TPA: bifunctional DNA-binding transcriptional regulator/O6-methylguanine-DNA methyltransferase Ada [Bryobacteraceae bacterium]|nr:bifunctional DNA-binding transcriptional regulator/O6-methylguanine-DNA methyltransferase Ada [Bryobacteraceae bacterium]
MGTKLEQTRWHSVLTRDRSADGAFVYAVQSTGVYCRPVCPSRRPRPEQVLFFDKPEEAERAGFRACRRCNPKDPESAIAEVCAHIERHAEDRLTLATLAREAGFSPFHLQRMFRKATGITPREYREALRMGSLKRNLKSGSDVTSALYDAGYGSSSRLYERGPEKLGMTPAIYRRGGAGILIRYTIETSPLGRLLVAATERGVCSVKMGDADADLEANLYAEFPNALVQRDRKGLAQFVRAILAHLAGEEPSLVLPTDLRATAFQTRVWEELRKIPYGETRSYAQVARAMGRPKAARAVARACASNPVALVIPCHRVVRGDGETGGYRWGAERKQKLLAREAEG